MSEKWPFLVLPWDLWLCTAWIHSIHEFQELVFSFSSIVLCSIANWLYGVLGTLWACLTNISIRSPDFQWIMCLMTVMRKCWEYNGCELIREQLADSLCSKFRQKLNWFSGPAAPASFYSRPLIISWTLSLTRPAEWAQTLLYFVVIRDWRVVVFDFGTGSDKHFG